MAFFLCEGQVTGAVSDSCSTFRGETVANSAFWHMVDTILIFLSHVLVVMFFTGLGVMRVQDQA